MYLLKLFQFIYVTSSKHSLIWFSFSLQPVIVVFSTNKFHCILWNKELPYYQDTKITYIPTLRKEVTHANATVNHAYRYDWTL